ncbi:MAG: YraN family protein [Bacteroidales bacterium]|nr:YraN family protein [Bacteroidales bacterium]MCF8343500.1 YraN family protein [Bacteroidales bacterium]MCF8349753.1 YraN family protein [Bacteroidales bacterium]MCF8376272.1 YraN family protein [Bacteroidales bacterium]MCF8401567.1 YraN family protein [Bacteroidales bacterium]
MAEHIDLGAKGEELAIAHLREKGYEILKTNWHFGREEIDIIAQNDEYLIIVEVKTRQSNYFGEPEIAVNKKKQKALIRAAHAFVIQREIDKEVRFDIIAIVIGHQKTVIRHLERAFYPTL